MSTFKLIRTMIQTKLKIKQKGYDTLFQRIQKGLDEVNEPEPSSGLEEFYGCMDFDGDPLEIQKRLRNEWN